MTEAGPLARVRHAVFLAIAALLAVLLVWLAWIAGHVAWYRYEPPRETAFMAQRMGEARAKNPNARLAYRWVPYAKISNNLKRAMIVSEDAKFLEHGGFDWDGIEKALDKNRTKGHVVAGGSTITQQVAKNPFLSPVKSYWRKGVEAGVDALPQAVLPQQPVIVLSLDLG